MARILKLADIVNDIDDSIAEGKRQIDDLNSHISRNRHDRQETKEAEEDIAEQESKIARLLRARSKLNALDKMTVRQNYIAAKSHIDRLNKKCEMLAARLDELDEKIESCEISMDSGVYDAAQCADYARDRARYMSEYDGTAAELARLRQQMKDMYGL